MTFKIVPDTSHVWRGLLSSSSLLGKGGARSAWRVGAQPYVVKLVERGQFMQHRNEVAVWGRAPGNVRRHLVPILCHGEDWLIQPFVTGVGKVPPRIHNELRNELMFYGIKDVSNVNIGLHEGRWKLFDYGVLRRKK